MSQGSLLSLSGQQKISIVGRDLRHVRFSAHRVLPSQLAHLITQSSGSFSDIDFENYNFDIENISESISKIESLPNIGRGKSQYTHFDFSSVMKQQGRNPKGLFLFEATSWNRENDYAESPSTKRLILLTDLGVILKKTVPGERLVFVQSIRSGRPVAGAEVKVMGKNGLPVVSGFTDENGQVRFKSLDDFRREKSPIAVTVETSSDFSFMPLNSKVPQLNFSKFDVGGVYSRFRESSLQAYLFSDRGIYRPGDEIRSGFIVKDSDWRKSQAQTIVEVQVRNPKGSIVKKERLKLTDVGLQEFKMKTSEVWPTGPYSIGLYLVQSEDRRMHLGSLTVKVEEFLPDRMKITARFSKTPNKGWLKPDQLKGSVLLQNLFGTPAQNRKVRTEISLSPSYPAFRSLKEYQFFDPLRSKRSYQEELAETTTNDKGEVVVDLGLDKYESASYHLNFIAEGFEAEGGRSVIASTSTLISPLDYLIGYKPEGSLNYLSKGSEMGVAVVAVDPDLKRLAVKGLKLRRIQYKPISALIKQGNGTYKYESVEKEVKLSEEDWTVADKESRLSLDTKEPGDYAYIILNEKGMELNRVRYSVMGAGNLSMDLEKNAELQVKLDKADYNPGDLVEVNIRAPYKGAGLITIERDDVYAYKWFQTDSSSSVQTIRIPKGLEGNGYVNVTFTRSLNSQEIFMSPLSVGVAPFSINKSSRINKIELKVPELIRPGSQIDIGYQSARIGKVVLFAIDQGILSVAKYQTPDPLSHFYKKKALEVTTQQILDLLLPEFELLEKRRSSQAGGAEALLGKNLNPFKRKQEKPVALWSGVKEIGPQLKNWKVTIPDYFSGQVKVIAVAVGHQSMDAHSESALVKGHFVISPNVPLMLAPGDRAIVSANVSNNVKDSGDSPEVTVRLSSSKGLLVKGEKEFKVKIAENSEKTVTFEVEAQEFLGNVDLKWETQWQDKLTERKSSLSLRPSSVYRSSIQSGVVKSQKQAEVATPRRLYSSLSKQQMQMSRLPIAVAFGLHNFLKTYPHGCTEQIVSQGFPGLLFSKNPEFGVSQKEALKSYRQLLGELRSREMPEGGVSVWPGSDIHGFFQSTYAAHYLTEAKDLGYVEGLSFLDSSLLNYLREYAERETKNLQMARVQAYAAYILTRNEKLATKALANLEEWFSGYKDDKWVSDITLLYMASAYQLMQAKDKANALLKRYQRSKDFLIDYELGVYDSNIHKLMSLFLFIKHFPERKDLYSEEDLIEIAESLGKNYNTRSAALASLAFVTYAERQKDLALLKDVKVTERSQNKTVATLRIPEKLFSAVAFSGNNEQLVLDNMGKSPIFYSQEQSGFSLPKTEPPKNQSIEVFREFLDTQGKPIEKVKVGEEVTVKLQLRSVDDKGHFNIAVVDLLPGGFEAVLDSIDRKWSSAEYVDIREDRVVLYMNSYPDVRSFTYKVKSVSRGQFVVPGIYATSMYDREVYSLGKESQIEVIP
ncbi:MAG: alpha-2-macroglobulin family protein [Bdellovibrionales bacterium]|nr:alpha-2-macroglobulin family protein [Bdellovibrionales bacterium]